MATVTGGQDHAEKGRGGVSPSDITGTARIIAGIKTFSGVRYRIGIVETKGKRSMVRGTIEATPAVISSLHDLGECAIELGSVLGWFGFVVTDVHRCEIKLTGWIKGA